MLYDNVCGLLQWRITMSISLLKKLKKYKYTDIDNSSEIILKEGYWNHQEYIDALKAFEEDKVETEHDIREIKLNLVLMSGWFRNSTNKTVLDKKKVNYYEIEKISGVVKQKKLGSELRKLIKELDSANANTHHLKRKASIEAKKKYEDEMEILKKKMIAAYHKHSFEKHGFYEHHTSNLYVKKMEIKSALSNILHSKEITYTIDEKDNINVVILNERDKRFMFNVIEVFECFKSMLKKSKK